jgi:hypothetical protein
MRSPESEERVKPFFVLVMPVRAVVGWAGSRAAPAWPLYLWSRGSFSHRGRVSLANSEPGGRALPCLCPRGCGIVCRQAGGSSRTLATADPFFDTRRDKLVALAASHEVPTIYHFASIRQLAA